MGELNIRRPDDFHVHLRQESMLHTVLPYTATQCARALVMPNIRPPATHPSGVRCYHSEIHAAMRARYVESFQPLMTIALTDGTMPDTIKQAARDGVVAGKLYPAGVTNMAGGVSQLGSSAFVRVLKTMEQVGMVLCVHGEDPKALMLDAEQLFLPTLEKIARQFPRLRIVLEHISSASAVQMVKRLPKTVAATVTAHHLMLTTNDVLGQPYHYCKPVAKTHDDLEALWEAVLSRDPKFFLGSDSAPHWSKDKECAKSKPGIFSAPVLLPLLATLFEQRDAVQLLEAFSSEFGAKFYGLEPNRGTLRLVRQPWIVPDECGGIVPFCAGQELPWQLAE